MQLEYLCKSEERVNSLNMEVSFLEMTKDIKPSTKSDVNTWQLLQPSKCAQFPKQSHFHSQEIFLPSLSYILGKGKSHILLVMIFKPDNHALSDIVIGSEKNLITLVTHTFLSNQAFQKTESPLSEFFPTRETLSLWMTAKASQCQCCAILNQADRTLLNWLLKNRVPVYLRFFHLIFLNKIHWTWLNIKYC